MFGEATKEERIQYYNEEWDVGELPAFLRDSLQEREFGFDHDGTGPKDRYNRFADAYKLEEFLKERGPFAVYSSISYYEEPEKRRGYKKAELAFDIDAKDLPIKNCCPHGQVCEVCLSTAKDFVLSITDVLVGDLGLEDIYYVYSGRGYHIRVLDEDVMHFGDTERAYILDYITGSNMLEGNIKIDWWVTPMGYTRIFRDRMVSVLKDASLMDLKSVVGIGSTKAQKMIDKKEDIINEIEEWRLSPVTSETIAPIKYRMFPTLKAILGKAGYKKLVDSIVRWNAGVLDAKVTVDVKRILRLPSSLHSKVSMKCMEVKDLESFDPLRDAVPKFIGERDSKI